VVAPTLIKNRYEVKDVLGRGGMGVVYKAFDRLMRREVAIKTLRDAGTGAPVDWFERECGVLSAMVHPNIVEIFDIGEFEENGAVKPYFVMPLLPGRTLYDLIYPAGAPLAQERCADIISQACRGLQAAHEGGLLHRDIKPRNIFVMRDDAVKLIDFGVVRLLGSQVAAAPAALGTLPYMAPEQIQRKPLTAKSDIFSLATVCYEALTGVHPFERQNEAETAGAVLAHQPALACALNPLVSQPLSQTVAQAMAKDPRKRFESAAAFADALQRSLRNERPLATLLPNSSNRVARAQRGFARGDYEFTREILDRLNAEGVDGTEVRQLRLQLDEAVRKRQSEVDLATARRYFENEEHALALRRVEDVLQANPSSLGAVSLKNEIEAKIKEIRVADALARAAGHLDNGGFSEARRLIEESLQSLPQHAPAQALFEETERRERAWLGQRQAQEALFDAAQSAYFGGRFDDALLNLEQLAELSGQSKAAGARAADYRNFYKRVQSDYGALQATLADARKLLASGDLDAAYLLSERLHEQYPQDPDVGALGKDIRARRQERDEEYRRGIEQRVANEPDWNARLHILTQAVRARPNDDHFHRLRQALQAKLQQVADAVERAQGYESAARFDHALEEWLCVGDIYPAYPGLREQWDRVQALWEAARQQAKATLNATVAQALERGDPETAARSLQAAQADFADDSEYRQLKAVVESAAQTYRDVASLLTRIAAAEREGHLSQIPELCRTVVDLSRNTEPLRHRTFAGLTATAARLTALNWYVAKQILQEAAALGAVPPALYAVIDQQEREQAVSTALSAEPGGGSADLVAYRGRITALMDKYPGDARLENRLRLLDAALEHEWKQDERRSCADKLALLDQELGDVTDHMRLWETQIRAKSLAAPYAGDPQVEALLAAIVDQVTLFERGAEELSRDHLQDCFAICDQVLARRPRHYLFQLLKDRAAARHRELGEEYLARVERWMASEPDFEKRREILEKAQAEYPFETRYAEELQHLQREKTLTASLAAKARDFEKRGQIPEALAQWRQLRNIHSAYPNLEELIANCEAIIDRQQRQVKVQRLLSHGQSQLAAGEFDEGYQALHEAWGLSWDLEGLLRSAAPGLIAAAGAVLPERARLAEQMTSLARALDDGLPVPPELSTRISEVRTAEHTSECLQAIHARYHAGDLRGALAVAEDFLAARPRVKPVEALRAQLWAEIDEDRKLQTRTVALDRFRQLENQAESLNPPGLLHLKQEVYRIASHSLGDEEVNRRASLLDAFFTSLAEIREHLQAHRASQAEAACLRALQKFPAHPLFQSAHAEAAAQNAERDAQYLREVKQRLTGESDFSKQAAILREALAQFPDELFLRDQSAAVQAKQRELESEINQARELEGKQLFAEAIKVWEMLRKAYPWYPSVNAEVERLNAEVERLTAARRKDKQEALDRWFRQVEKAIQTCDYETASAMIRQAQQQQPDRKLQGLDIKLQDGLKRKEASDFQLAEGQRLLSQGSLLAGAQALTRAHELQPGDKQRTDFVAELLIANIRAHLATDFAVCEELLSLLQRIAPNQALPSDLSDAIARTRQAAEARRIDVHRMQEQLARLANQAEGARSQRSLSSVKSKLHDSGLSSTKEVEIQRAAKDLLAKINARLAGFESALVKVSPAIVPSQRLLSNAGLAVGVLLAIIGAAIIFFVSSRPSGVPVQISVRPDHATIELDGRTCIAPDCNFTLKPGKYTINLRKAGYKDRTVVITVKPGDTTPLNLNASLEPLASPI
jgi:serine/threonine-protein kinase